MVTTATEADAARLVPDLQAQLDQRYPEARIIVRDLVQGPPVAAPVEVRLVGPDLETLRSLGDDARALMADLPLVTQVRSGVTGGAPQIRFNIDETNSRLLGFDLTTIAGQLQSSLVGVNGGSLVEGTEQLPIRVRFDDAFRGSLQSISEMPVILPGGAGISARGELPFVPLSAIAQPVLEPAPSVITRRNGERMNTVQAFIVPGVLPEEALQTVSDCIGRPRIRCAGRLSHGVGRRQRCAIEHSR